MRLEAELLLDAMDGLAYLTDEDGVVLAVAAAAWNGFALQNGGDEVVAARTLGRSVFAGMQPEIAKAYRRVHAKLLGGETGHVAFEYRCDAPDERREMRMSISVLPPPREGPMLLHQSQILSRVARPWVSLFEAERILAHAREERGLPIVRLCGFCQKVAWPTGSPDSWIEAEDYYRKGGAADVRTSHGVCGPCQARL